MSIGDQLVQYTTVSLTAQFATSIASINAQLIEEAKQGNTSVIISLSNDEKKEFSNFRNLKFIYSNMNILITRHYENNNNNGNENQLNRNDLNSSFRFSWIVNNKPYKFE